MSTPAQAPVYLDDSGNPKGAAAPPSAPAAPAPQSGGSVYLDDDGNPKGQAPAAAPAAKPQGPTIGPQPNNNLDLSLLSNDPFQKVGLKIATPFARKAMDAIDKLREVENFTQEGQQAHPVQAFMGHIANRLEGFLFGNEQHPEDAIGTGKTGILTNPVTGMLLPGAEGAPVLAEGIEGAANMAKSGVSAVKEALSGGEETPGVIKQALKGKGVAQEPAKAAIREAAGAGDDATLLEGNKTIADERLSDLAAKEKEAYAKMDEAAGFDVKEAKIRMKNDQYKLKQLGNTEADQNAREKLTTAIKDTSDRIADANEKMKAAGVDTAEADNLHKSRMAGQEFKKALVRNLSSDGETVNVDGLLTAVKNLRALSKYGDRLEQFLGKEGADTLMENLQDAQELGAHALRTQKIFKWLAGTTVTGGIAGEAAKHLLP